MKCIISIVCLLVCGLPPSVSALEIAYSKVNPFSGVPGNVENLVLRGEIVPGDYETLLQILRGNETRFWRSNGFVLASPGGDIQEALRIARLVKGTYSMVWVSKETGPCVSACFFIYSAAVRREAGDRTLGIHRPYVHPRRLDSMSAPEAETLQKNVLRQARSYLESQDVPTNRKRAANTP